MHFHYVWHIIHNTFHYKRKFDEIVGVYGIDNFLLFKIKPLVFSNCTFKFTFLVHVSSGFFNKKPYFFRSTSIEEGTAIAMSICDVLAKSKAFTFITTHFTLLAKLADLFFNIKVYFC